MQSRLASGLRMMDLPAAREAMKTALVVFDLDPGIRAAPFIDVGFTTKFMTISLFSSFS